MRISNDEKCMEKNMKNSSIIWDFHAKQTTSVRLNQKQKQVGVKSLI